MPRPSGDSARDRLNLFISLVPFVLKRGSVSVADAAAQFGVSHDQIVDAFTTIACDGGSNEARLNFNTELFNIDWEELEYNDVLRLTVAETLTVPTPFSARQRTMFLAGLELLKAMPHYRGLPELDGLIDKLRGYDSNAVTNVFSVVIDEGNDVAVRLDEAISGRRRVKFTYTTNAGEREVREVDPYRLDFEGGAWYLRGYCYLRNDTRTFNLDSLEALEILDATIEDRSIDALSIAGPLFSESDRDVQVTVSIDSQALALIAAYRRPADKPVSRGDATHIEIPFTHAETAIRMISVLAGVAAIVEPGDLRTQVANHAQATLDAYRAFS